MKSNPLFFLNGEQASHCSPHVHPFPLKRSIRWSQDDVRRLANVMTSIDEIKQDTSIFIDRSKQTFDNQKTFSRIYRIYNIVNIDVKYGHYITITFNLCFQLKVVAQECWRMFVPYTLQIQRFPVAAVARAACGTPTWQTKVRECGANSHTMRPWELSGTQACGNGKDCRQNYMQNLVFKNCKKQHLWILREVLNILNILNVLPAPIWLN